MIEDKYTEFFEKVKKFKEKQKKQKQRGLNDFNLLSTVRKYHDEVYLHSTMIGALLDPKGLHYQDTLFLEKFLEVLSLDDFKLDLSNVTVGVEYQDIDLYITDSVKHIILENKIWAEDQPCQIIKYINIIKEENDLMIDDSYIPKIDDIYVVYLTPNNKQVSYEHTVNDGYISFKKDAEDKLKECSKRANTKSLVPNGLKNYQTRYKKINYQNDILNWLNKSIQEIENITNLNEAVKQYIDVVKMVNNNYKGKVITMEKLILENEENMAIVNDIYNSFDNIRVKIIKDFFMHDLVNYFQEQFFTHEKYKDWIIELDKDILKPSFYAPIRIGKKDWKVIFKFAFESKDLNSGYYGISINNDNIPLKNFREEMYPKLKEWKKNTSISLFWNYIPHRKDSYSSENIVDFKFNQEKIAEEYFKLFENTMNKLETEYKISMEKINSDMDEYIKKNN